jgi:hypothetical protein
VRDAILFLPFFARSPEFIFFGICRASGHVYVAKALTTGKKVAIKEMDLAHQPRKELIVNEILVMKESQHPNIVNFLESYLVKSTELWVVMEFMEGGALTDIIENNQLEEDQISSISLEVSQVLSFFYILKWGFDVFRDRRVGDWDICIVRVLSIGISSLIMSSSTRKVALKSVASPLPLSRLLS